MKYCYNIISQRTCVSICSEIVSGKHKQGMIIDYKMGAQEFPEFSSGCFFFVFPTAATARLRNSKTAVKRFPTAPARWHTLRSAFQLSTSES